MKSLKSGEGDRFSESISFFVLYSIHINVGTNESILLVWFRYFLEGRWVVRDGVIKYIQADEQFLILQFPFAHTYNRSRLTFNMAKINHNLQYYKFLFFG